MVKCSPVLRIIILYCSSWQNIHTSDYLPVKNGLASIVALESTAAEVRLSREFGAVVSVVPSLLKEYSKLKTILTTLCVSE
jgi:hypothetical protein